MASPPFSVIIWTVWCPPSSFMSAITSLAPSLANVRAVALPIPDAPPVGDKKNKQHFCQRPGDPCSSLDPENDPCFEAANDRTESKRCYRSRWRRHCLHCSDDL